LPLAGFWVMDFNKINTFLIKIDQVAAIFLGFFIFLFIVSGYGIEKGIFDPVFAKWLHDKILPLPTFLTFLFHFFLRLKFIFLKKKWIKDDLWWNLYFLVLAIILFLIFLYFYFL